MIRLNDVSFSYKGSERGGSLHHVSLAVQRGEVVVLCGKSGCGKTTLTRLLNGLIPHFYPGGLSGEVLVGGINTAEQPVHETAKTVGSVFQNPRSQFFNVDSTSEVVFGCENMGWEVPLIDRSLGRIVREMDISDLMGPSLFQLSGGEKQKIACASVSMLEPELLVLDEPASNLDWTAIRTMTDMIAGWKRRGKTVVIAEHRLSYLREIADRVIYMEDGRIVEDVPAAEFWAQPPVEIRRRGLRSLEPVTFADCQSRAAGSGTLDIRDFSFAYGRTAGIRIDSLSIPKGSIVGVLGNNGVGKSTFARCLCGLEKKASGRVALDGRAYGCRQRRRLCYLVMQDVNHQLFTESVRDEVLIGMERGADEEKEGKAGAILESLDLGELKELHPLSLSGGQKQRVAIASAVAAEKEVIVFDEPTSGLDYHHMLEVSQLLKQLSGQEKTLFIITHDPELLEQCCDYLVFLEAGTVAWNGGWREESKERVSQFFSSFAMEFTFS